MRCLARIQSSIYSSYVSIFPRWQYLLPNLRFLEVRNDCPVDVKGIHRLLKVLWERSECALESLIFNSQVGMTYEQRAEYSNSFPRNRNNGRGILSDFLQDIRPCSTLPELSLRFIVLCNL